LPISKGSSRTSFSVRSLRRHTECAADRLPDRFEALLDFVDLCGPIAESVSRDLRELEQVRNVIVHRNGVVDRRLVEVAYVVAAEIGDHLRLTRDDDVWYLGRFPKTSGRRWSSLRRGRGAGPGLQGFSWSYRLGKPVRGLRYSEVDLV
jgi:hypothetical protein